MTIHTYLPQDRLRALVRGEALLDRTSGSALFADISGFTALTESLRESLGARQGAEELSKQLGEVYSALIAEVEKYRGSVIGFAGDAMMCWFNRRNDELRSRIDETVSAISSAFGMQKAIQAFPALGLKVAITSGDARRFVIGDPEIQQIDVLAGTTVARTSTAEHLAVSGDIVLDEASISVLGDTVSIKEWREDNESKERFAVVSKFTGDIDEIKTESVDSLSDDVLKSWVHQAVFERETSGQGTFLTEFRPCVALFVRFTGIDFDSNSASAELDVFIRQVQRIASRYGGTLLDITIGDKGSYAYVNFGALSTHEDDARRAVKAAWELMKVSSLQLQMGIAQGLMRVGAYGGVTRRTYSALGDDVNLAARLMTTASAGEILLSGPMHKAVLVQFTFEPRAPLSMKGKAEPLPVFAATGEREQRSIRLQEPTYALPMVGREEELGIINDKLELAIQGKGQAIGIVAEAGLGKSRLVAEAIRSARRKGFVGFGGACQSDGLHTPYLAWKSIWQAFFDIDPLASWKRQLRWLEGEIEERAPQRIQAMPLLSILLNLEIPENEFTQALESKYRQSALHALLEDCLRAASVDEPTIIVLEDLHWMDALSYDLLEELARGLSDCRICFVLAYRPSQLIRLNALPQFTKIELHELNQTEAEQAIRAKLAQLYPARSGALPTALAERLMTRAQGNPFYLEELLNYLRDRGLDLRESSALEHIDLPDSLHTLILSRLDQLSEREKTTLRVASIVGRLFRVQWLIGCYPDLGSLNRVQADLDQLASLDITSLESPEPELAYLFKHIITHEVTYESLPFATRAQLHGQLALYLENIGTPVDTIAHHYGRSNNVPKQREYFEKAANAALGVSAFNTAADYLTQLVQLTPNNDPARSALALQLAEAHYRLGNFAAARIAIEQAQASAQTGIDRAAALAVLGEMMSETGDYEQSAAILTQAVPQARSGGDKLTLCRTLYALGDVNWRQGKWDEAKNVLNESLQLARELGDLTRELFVLNRLGTVALLEENLEEGERLFTEVHTRAAAAGNRERAMTALNNLGGVADRREDLALGQEYGRQALALAREVGLKHDIALFLVNQAFSEIQLGQLDAAQESLREGLSLALSLGAFPWAVAAVKYFGYIAHARGDTKHALALIGLARNQPAWSSDDQYQLEEMLKKWELDQSVIEAGLKKGEELDWDKTIDKLLKE